MNYISANVTSAEDAIKRLVNGEIFYYQGRKIWYDAEQLTSGTPFRLEADHGSCGDTTVKWFWKNVRSFQMEKPYDWREDIDSETGTVCWVTDNPNLEQGCETKVALVTGYDECYNYPYRTNAGVGFLHARPVKPSELLELP